MMIALSVREIAFADSFAEEVNTQVVMLDSTGAIQWSTSLSELMKDDGVKAGEFPSIISTIDNDFIVAGAVIFDESDDYGMREKPSIIKINPTGNIVWEVEFPDDIEGTVYSVTRANDNGYIFCGNIYVRSGAEETLFYKVGFLEKINAAGEIEWKKIFDDEDNISFENENCEIDMATSNYYFVAGGEWVIKVDSNGNEVWRKHLNFSPWNKSDDEPNGHDNDGGTVMSLDFGYTVAGIVVHSDESVVAFGRRMAFSKQISGENSVLMTYLDVNGELKYSNILKYEGLDGTSNIRVLSKGQYFLIYREYDNAMIKKIDASGNVLWTYDFDSLPKGRATISSVSDTADDGILITMRTISDEETACNMDAVIIKLDENGSLGMMVLIGDKEMDDISAVSQSSKGEYLAVITSVPASAFEGFETWDN